MKLYFGVTTFKSSGYLSRKSYIMDPPHLSGYFPYNSGHFIKKLIDLIAKARFEIIFGGHHI
jgi:hypothetical protein